MLKTSADVKALTYCGLQRLSSRGLAEVLKLYPEYAAAFRAGLPRDLTFNLRQGSDTSVRKPRMASTSASPRETSGIALHLKTSSLDPRQPRPLPLPCLTPSNPTGRLPWPSAHPWTTSHRLYFPLR